MSTWKRLTREHTLERLEQGYQLSIPSKSFSPSDYLNGKKLLTKEVKSELDKQFKVRTDYTEYLENKYSHKSATHKALLAYLQIELGIVIDKDDDKFQQYYRDIYSDSI